MSIPADNGNREREIFEAALDIESAEERLGYLKGACGEDAALLARVQALLQAHEAPEGFLPERPRQGATVSLVTEKPGDRIGHYKLLEQIGEGGCGVVYMAEQTEPIQRRVALKVIKLGMDTKHVIGRFEAERQALALMDHPNIAKVLDAGATETGRPYFVMELVRGVKITDYCDENLLSTEERLNLFVQVCHAIQHAHQKGVIHRDIKPSNILVTLNDGVRVPKVIDFGIAKAVGQQLTDKTVFTSFEQFIGTPAYMSPEQAVMTSLDVDTRSDIYALGVLLYELLTGHTPFEQKELVAAGLDEMRRIIREQEPARPSTRLSTLGDPEQTTVAERRSLEPPELIHLVRGDLDWIVMKCLEKDRARRYETANGLADDVMRHLNNEPVAARPPSRVYLFQKLVRRNRLVFAAGAAVVGALVIGLGLSTWLFFKEQAARRRAVAAETTQSQLRRQAQAEAKKSEQVAKLLTDMLQGVGPSVALGRDTTLLREILDKTAERVGKDLKDQPEVEAELRSTIGGVYDALGQYQKAEAMYRSALTLRQELYGNMNTNVADSLDNLGAKLVWHGEIAAAESAFQKALAIRTNLLGSQHVKVAASLYNLGSLRVLEARFSEAEDLFQQSLAIRIELRGNEHIDVADSLSGLSFVFINSGKPAEAEAAARKALAIQARVSPDERSVVGAGITQLRLGLALLQQNKLAEAEPFVRQALTIRTNLLGTEHPEVAQALDILAMVLMGEEKLADAEAAARAALAISRKTPGEQHFTTGLCLGHLGAILRKAGRLSEAETAYREALVIWHQVGELNVAGTCSLLAAVLQEQGKLSEVEALYRAEVETARKSPDRTSRGVSILGTSLARLADFLRDQGKPGEAEAAYTEGLALCRKSLTNRFSTYLWLTLGYGSLLRNQGRVSEAESLYRESLDEGGKLPPNSALARVFATAADLLRDQGNAPEAEPLYREGLDMCRQVLTNDFTVRQWLSGGLCTLLRQQARLAEAEDLSRETVAVGRKLPPSVDLTRVLAVFADVLRDEGKLAEAEPRYREGLDLCRTVSTNDFEPRWWLTGGLVGILKTQGNLAESEALYRETIDAGRKSGATNALPGALAALADLLRDQGKAVQAEPVYREGLELCRSVSPNDAERRTWLAAGLGVALKSQGRLAEAEAAYREAVTNAAKLWPKDPGRWQWQVNDLAYVLRSQGKTNELETLKHAGLENGVGQSAQTSRAKSFAAAGDTLRDQGKLAEAEPVYRQGLDICRQSLTNEIELHKWLAAGLGLALKTQGKLAAAESAYREAITNAAKVWPKDAARWQWQVNDLADVLHGQGKLAEANKLVAELIKPGPQSPSERVASLRARIDLSGRRGQWKETAAELTQLLELDPSNAYAQLQLAAVLAQAGDRDAYQVHCRKMLARFGGTNDAVIADQTAKACLLLPGSGLDLEAVSQLAEKALTLGRANAWFSFLQMDEGLAAYRREDYARAVDSMRKALGQPMSVGRPLPAWERDVAAAAVLAMAQHQLKQTDAARASLAKASELAQTKLPQFGRDDLEADWVDWLIAQVLLREAQALVNGEPRR